MYTPIHLILPSVQVVHGHIPALQVIAEGAVPRDEAECKALDVPDVVGSVTTDGLPSIEVAPV
jgi:hypothetical protein